MAPVLHRGRDPLGLELVADASAFLTGWLVERIEEGGGDVPVWAWTNLLAHGTEADLCSERAAEGRSRLAAGGDWHEARSFLAAEVLDLSEGCGSLAELQRSTLLPLELALASSSEVARWDPGHLVAAVRAVLGEYRQSCRRAPSRQSGSGGTAQTR